LQPRPSDDFHRGDQYERRTDWLTQFQCYSARAVSTSKTAAAIRSQAPVVTANLVATIDGRASAARYDGYTACPFVTEYGKVLMAEFNYDKKPAPTLPLLDPGHEHRAGWVLKRHVLKPMYFDAMLRGRA
jgi:sulfide:quinone oxidoreductase